VDVDFFADAPARERRGMLVVSALVPYKRIEVAVEWATGHGEELTVVGDGAERARLEQLAGPTVHFVGALGRERLRDAYAGAEALLFPGVEDFGIVPVEAMAAGCPVVALARGGALETVAGAGVLFDRPNVGSLGEAVDRLRQARNHGEISADNLQERARRFDRSRFVAGLHEVLGESIAGP
jgi:glycosyltransferase involved in cell wall biosynthesis